MRHAWMIAIFLFVGAAEAWGKPGPRACSADFPVGEKCLIPIRRLHPTEFAVGYREVEEKASKLRKMSPDEVADEIKDKPAPCIIGPGGVYYMIDHHHFSIALERVGIDTMRATVVANLSHYGETRFYQIMQARHWFWLYDQYGRGPLDPRGIPGSVHELADDPYRSLAGSVRHEGGYEDTDILFADFYWANFFRTRIRIAPGETGFARAVREGLTWARSAQARGLPGYRGR